MSSVSSSDPDQSLVVALRPQYVQCLLTLIRYEAVACRDTPTPVCPVSTDQTGMLPAMPGHWTKWGAIAPGLAGQ